jgi:hypothetical protein
LHSNQPSLSRQDSLSQLHSLLKDFTRFSKLVRSESSVPPVPAKMTPFGGVYASCINCTWNISSNPSNY